MKVRLLSTFVAACMTCSVMAIKTDDLKWHSMKDFPLYGTVAKNQSVNYVRVPDSLKKNMRPELYDLATNTAGMYIRFASDASAIGAKWKATKKFDMNHMTATGIRGLDLYTMLDDGTWTTVSSARPSFFRHNTTTMVMTDMTPRMREYMLYLPLYDGVDSIYIGVDSMATVCMPSLDSPVAANPIIMYGTSILQGGCASRSGMVHTSIIGRKLNRQVINLGFSGNARLDLDIAGLIADTPASVIVVDPLPNLKTPELVERMPAFIAAIRSKQPSTPILLVESPIFPLMRFNEETLQTITEKNKALQKIYDDLVSAGDANIHYFKGEDVLGDCVEGTVDNYHLTDLGFTHFADALSPVISALINGTGPGSPAR
ncbi:MAG: SGNH/GDSL hydrolase family protein [Bacteroidales bacterium]|nr:SGNH/GDSL hydrolase family protein [Bacteroidales bacterium]